MARLKARWRWAVGLLLAGCMLGGVVLWSRMEGPEDFWAGSDRLSVSERAYVLARASWLLDEWRSTRYDLYRVRGQAPAPYPVDLVVDLRRPAMWIERDGRVWDGRYVALPTKLDWSLHRSTPDNTETLPALSRFKIRGWGTGPEPPERVYVVGRISAGGHVAFVVAPGVGGVDYGSGDFRPTPMPAPQRTSGQRVDPYPSIVMTEDECRALPDPAVTVPAPDAAEEGPRADWERIEAKFYREMERQVCRQGLRLDQLTVRLGPDCHAGHAELRARRGALRGLLPGGLPPTAVLNFDYLGEGVWYVCSTSAPRPGPPASLTFEFLVADAERLPGSEAEWMEKGREKAAAPTRGPSPWRLTLSNGATVEFLGVCTAPTLGRQWWGPDGSPLAEPPFESGRTFPSGPDRKQFEIAYRLVLTAGASGVSHVTRSASGSMGGGYAAAEDRHGWPLSQEIQHEQYVFRATQQTTTLRVGVAPSGTAEMQWAEFRKVSLVPGTDFGFEMGVGEATATATEQGSH